MRLGWGPSVAPPASATSPTTVSLLLQLEAMCRSGQTAPAPEPPGQHTAVTDQIRTKKAKPGQKLSLLIQIARCSALAKSTPALKKNIW